MNFKKRVVSVFLVVCLVVAAIVAGEVYMQQKMKPQEFIEQFTKETIHIWYTDESMTDYLNQVALSFYEENDIRVAVELVSGLEYLENINQASLDEETDTPDMYIISNDSLEKAYLAGLASAIQDPDNICNTDTFSETALNAVTYQDNMVGYPFYFETSALLYNKTYLEQIARETVEEEMGITTEDGEAEEDETEETDAEEIEEETVQEQEEVQIIDAFADCDPTVEAEAREREEDMVPASIVDILNFADSYDAPANVEAIFKWDVSDIFYNYFFIGNYISVGGPAGYDKEHIDIYNQDAIASLKVYQELNQFFSIDADAVDYDSVIQDFLAGKTIFTIATSDALTKIEEAREQGTFPYEYGIATIPDINEQLQTKGMSVTETIAINGYSEKKTEANLFASYLIGKQADTLYDKTGKIAVNQTVTYENEWIPVFLEAYAQSEPIPKMIETSNFWILLENCFTKVWSGEDANGEIKALSEQIMTQLTGEAYEEEYIEDPEVELLPEDTYEDTGMS